MPNDFGPGPLNRRDEPAGSHRTILVAGVGNIGSYLGPLLLRAGVGRLRLVDRDRVEAKNLDAQDYRPEDVGRFKADVQAERLRQQFPGHTVGAYPVDLEDLPVGLAAVDLVLGALDNRRARQVLVGEIAWPLGVPVIDGGVGDNRLGRVQAFLPAADSACLECTWGAADYRLAAAEYPCIPGAGASVAATGAPAFLGSFVASLMVSEAVRLLAGRVEGSYEVPFDLVNHALRRYALRRAARCRHDHEVTREVIAIGAEDDLAAVVRRRLGEGPIRVEARRGLGRFLTPQALVGMTSAQLGMVAGDWLRVRSPAGSVWLVVSG